MNKYITIVFHALQKKRIAISLTLAATVLFTAATTYSQSQKEIEYRFKAVYLLNFLQFIEWPDSYHDNDQSPIILSIVGDDPFGEILDETFRNEKIGGHPVVLYRFDSITKIGKCHAVFICESEKNIPPEMLQKLNAASILTISDMDDFGDRGGSIGFYLERNKVRFEINMKALKQGDLKASSKLLRLARITNPL
ncbi:MAG: YfiR family protein [Ignavibacteriales bacterium]|nr:YfiR family protein [Ignavibacteriales bacterium]